MTETEPRAAPPLVSVIVPIFNAERYLERTLTSVTSQDYTNLEIVLVDDGSTDRSAAICDAHAARDSRIKLLHVENGGPSRARNLGLDVARGSFILFVDADDPLEPRAIDALVKCQAESDADVVVGNFVKDHQGERQPSGHRLAFRGDAHLDAKDIFVYVFECYLRKPNRYHLFVYVWGRLLRADVIRRHALRFDETLSTYEDVAFNFDFLRACGKPTLRFLDRVVLTKTVPVHDGHSIGSESVATNARSQFGYIEACKHIAAYLADGPIEFDYGSRLRHAFMVYTIIQLVRIAGQWSAGNRGAITSLVDELVADPSVREALHFYRPTGADSRVIPWLIRYRMVRALIAVCRWKSSARYGRTPTFKALLGAQGAG